jgi:hypothetical protein
MAFPASANEPPYPIVVSHKLGRLDEARAEITVIRDRVPPEKKHVFATIEADYLLARGEIDNAASLAAMALDQRRDVVTLGLMAKIEAVKAKQTAEDGMSVLSSSHRSRAETLIREGLKLDPSNGPLRSQLELLLRTDG